MTAAAAPQAILEVVDLMFARGSFQLGPLSLQVAAGERVWLAGPNGSGKSTLLQLVAGLIAADSGTIRISGQDMQSTQPWARPCSMLLQGLGLWPHLSIRKQCSLAASKAATTEDAAIQQRLATIAAELEVTTLLDRYPGELSGGEAQRCALLRTLMKDAPLLLLDEPYAAQHDAGITAVETALERLAGAGCAIVIAGHQQPAEARRVSIAAERRSQP
ncbi:MAG: ATP-binding cassette domain-containing protein [Planctomycetota bacterium]